jgi:hypothetical protein
MRVPRLPSQVVRDAIGAGHQHGGIARPTRRDVDRNLALSHAGCGVDDFADGITVPTTPEVIASACAGLADSRQCEDVSAREIIHVDVVANACAVGCRIIAAEHAHVRSRRTAATSSTIGMRWVSGSCCSPRCAVAPAALK